MITKAFLLLGFPQKFSSIGTHGVFTTFTKKAYRSCTPKGLLVRKERVYMG